jgi:hypothetical protein
MVVEKKPNGKAASRRTCRRSPNRKVAPTLSGVFDRYSVTTIDSIGDLHFRSVTRSVTDRCIRYGQKVANPRAKERKRKTESRNQGLVPYHASGDEHGESPEASPELLQRGNEVNKLTKKGRGQRTGSSYPTIKTRARQGGRTACNVVTSQCLQGYCGVFKV